MKKLSFSTFISSSISFVENLPLTFSLWLGAFLGIITLRLLLENFLAHFQYRDISFLFFEFTHTLLFFFLSYLLFLIFLSWCAKTNIKQSANVLLFGFFIILLPPIIDRIISGGSGFWSFYEFDGLSGLILRFFTFFGNDPTIGITYGVRIEVALSLLFLGLYTYFKTRDLFRTICTIFLGYTLFFILGTFPSWIAIFTLGWTEGFLTIQATDVAKMFLSPELSLSQTPGDLISTLNAKMSLIYGILASGLVCFFSFLYYPKHTIILLRNARWVQVFYHGGLLCVGGGLALLFSPSTLTHITFFNSLAFLLLLLSGSFAWFSSVIVNDIFDQDIDQLSNQKRPLIQKTFSLKTYSLFGWMFFFLSIFFALLAHPFAPFFILSYHTLSWIYSAPPFRLKRFLGIATLISALASLMFLFSGYIFVDKTNSLNHIPWQILLFLLYAYTISLPLKDFKDMKGDKKASIWTLPVLLGQEKARVFLAIGIFSCYILSVIILNAFSLAPWAFLFGTLSYWVITHPNISYKKRKVFPRYLPHILFSLVFLYGLILLATLVL
jgi:4-hydroxybenzoate polyprenyltransferase